MVFGCAEGTSGWGAARTASISCMKVLGCSYLSRKCSVFFAVWEIHVGGFAAGGFLGNSGDECNPVAAQLRSGRLCLCGGVHARIAGAALHTDLAVDRNTRDARQPFCRESRAVRAASDAAG